MQNLIEISSAQKSRISSSTSGVGAMLGDFHGQHWHSELGKEGEGWMQRDKDCPAQYPIGLEIIFSKCESMKRMSGNI